MQEIVTTEQNEKGGFHGTRMMYLCILNRETKGGWEVIHSSKITREQGVDEKKQCA